MYKNQCYIIQMKSIRSSRVSLLINYMLARFFFKCKGCAVLHGKSVIRRSTHCTDISAISFTFASRPSDILHHSNMHDDIDGDDDKSCH